MLGGHCWQPLCPEAILLLSPAAVHALDHPSFPPPCLLLVCQLRPLQSLWDSSSGLTLAVGAAPGAGFVLPEGCPGLSQPGKQQGKQHLSPGCPLQVGRWIQPRAFRDGSCGTQRFGPGSAGIRWVEDEDLPQQCRQRAVGSYWNDAKGLCREVRGHWPAPPGHVFPASAISGLPVSLNRVPSRQAGTSLGCP